ncbi:MAG: signal peptide peptidase SppA [Verrucomicrobia bacterium]|nr:signal peptide peptidase SppA [Verrucomicrobiota bacterium]
MESNLPPAPEYKGPTMNPPPIITLPPASRPPRKSRGWKIFAIILLVLLVLSLFANLSHLTSGLAGVKVRSAHYAGPKLEEVILKDNDSANKIAVVDVEGIITGQVIDRGGVSLVDLIKEQLSRAEEDRKVRAVLLRVNSPGGEVLASDEIYRLIAKFQTEAHKPVVASMGSLAASGGYYVSAPCRWIVANELTITGSIGVIMHGYNYRGLMNKIGLRPEVYKSGKFKDMLSGDRNDEDIPAEERQMVQALIDETFGKFKSVVAEGRKNAKAKNREKGNALSADWEDYADGRVLSGKEAEKLGFVDELGDFETAVEAAKRIAGVGRANLIQYQQRFDLADFFQLFGSTDARTTLKVDVGMDFPKLQAGQLYFISPTVLH